MLCEDPLCLSLVPSILILSFIALFCLSPCLFKDKDKYLDVFDSDTDDEKEIEEKTE